MSTSALFVIAMIVVGTLAGSLFTLRPQFAVFPYITYFTVLAAMALLELGLMLSGRLKRPIQLEVRLAGLVFGFIAAAMATAIFTAK